MRVLSMSLFDLYLGLVYPNFIIPCNVAIVRFATFRRTLSIKESVSLLKTLTTSWLNGHPRVLGSECVFIVIPLRVVLCCMIGSEKRFSRFLGSSYLTSSMIYEKSLANFRELTLLYFFGVLVGWTTVIILPYPHPPLSCWIIKRVKSALEIRN